MFVINNISLLKLKFFKEISVIEKCSRLMGGVENLES